MMIFLSHEKEISLSEKFLKFFIRILWITFSYYFMIFGSTTWFATTFWFEHARSSSGLVWAGFWSVSSLRWACHPTTDTVGTTQLVSTSSSRSIYVRMSLIFPRSFELSPGILESFSAIFCSSSCPILIFSYILGSIEYTLYYISKRYKIKICDSKKVLWNFSGTLIWE